MSGDDVKMLQAVLNYHRTPGDALLAVDGAFGDHTRDRVKSFQSLNQLAPDGIVQPPTRPLLMTICRCQAKYQIDYPPVFAVGEGGPGGKIRGPITTEYTLSNGVKVDLTPWERPPARLHYVLEFEAAFVIKNPQLPGQLSFAVGTALGTTPTAFSPDSTAVYSGDGKVLAKFEKDFELGPITLDASLQAGFETTYESGLLAPSAALSLAAGVSFAVQRDRFYLFTEGALGAAVELSGSVQPSPQWEGTAGFKLTF
jgi:hypothetical protein